MLLRASRQALRTSQDTLRCWRRASARMSSYVAGKIQAHLLAPRSHRSSSVHVLTHCVRARKPTAILPSRARDEAHVCPVDAVQERPRKGSLGVRAVVE